ncbi:Oryzin [Dactylellina cionopaga]|nr:Oryzin [Dactylellina cionopaga]
MEMQLGVALLYTFSTLASLPTTNKLGGHTYDDENGHGTHCAGTVAGKTYGVAKKAKIVSVQNLNATGEGPVSELVEAMNWVFDKANPYTSIASLSQGEPYSVAVNRAVDELYNAGITVVVAAGNDAVDASTFSPASAANAITVGATDINNAIAYFSNTGTGVDVFAPGVKVLSAWISTLNLNTHATNTISGTSMACPHISGMIACYMSGQGGVTPDEAADWIISNAIVGTITGDLKGSPNRLAYTGFA